LQSHPWSWGRRGWPESGETGGAPGRGRGRGRPHAHLGSGGGRSWGGGVAGVGARRWPAAAAAAARGSGEGRAHGWQCVTWGGATGPRKRLGWLAGSES
jgi:hypothetical protein